MEMLYSVRKLTFLFEERSPQSLLVLSEEELNISCLGRDVTPLQVYLLSQC